MQRILEVKAQRVVQRIVEFLRCQLQLPSWLFRVLFVALGRASAFLVGTPFEDEHAAFSAHALVRNDAYRDRLLVPEIEALAALSDALQLMPAQRRALFRCFLHVDFLRRASVSRAELLRYCGLRSTPLSAFLLPIPHDGATHRDTGDKQRWDVLQWVALCFSVCTLEFDAVRHWLAEERRRRLRMGGERLTLDGRACVCLNDVVHDWVCLASDDGNHRSVRVGRCNAQHRLQ